MNDTAIIALAAGVPLFTAQLVQLWISSRNNKALREVKEEAKVITGHVNSAATAAAEKINGLEKQISDLTTALSERKETAALLAQAAATKQVAAVPQAAGPTEVVVVNPPSDPVPTIIAKTK